MENRASLVYGRACRADVCRDAGRARARDPDAASEMLVAPPMGVWMGEEFDSIPGKVR